MMADPVDYASFMIRMWRDPEAAPDGEADERDAYDEAAGEEMVWVGEIEFVQSGRILPFRGLEALAKLLVA